jgi:hypothetical protein
LEAQTINFRLKAGKNTMKLFKEADVLDLGFRRKVIEEIKSPENSHRKYESLKRYEIYKDRVKRYVVDALIKEGLKPETVEQMANRCSNISICRKVVNKLARTYSGGVSRETSSNMESTQTQIDELSRLLCFDEKMRKGDRYRELQKNMMFQIVPEGTLDPSIEAQKYKLSMRCLLPWHYDVIEDCRDREIARCVILSDFVEGRVVESSASESEAGYHRSKPYLVDANKNDEIIADNPRDAGGGKKRVYVWWTENYHFTTDEKGEILSNPKNPANENPIKRLPFVNNADDQDGQFWAIGGDDLIDGSVLVNKIITDMFFIAWVQGWGQWVVTGRKLTDRIVIGPNNAIVLDYDPESGDPKPEVNVVSANPPLESWMRSIEQYMALLLTTNNLSPANVSMKLDANTFPSGIAILVEMSEATDDISDKQKSYKDIERQLWEIIKLWHNMLLESGELADEFAEIDALPEDLKVSVKFNEIKPVISESEKLDVLKKRKDLGLNSALELLKLDNPDLTDDEAIKKLLEIKKEKLENMKAVVDVGAPAPKDDAEEMNMPGMGDENADAGK